MDELKRSTKLWISWWNNLLIKNLKIYYNIFLSNMNYTLAIRNLLNKNGDYKKMKEALNCVVSYYAKTEKKRRSIENAKKIDKAYRNK